MLAGGADGALGIVDQHAAHERLTEERLRAEFLAGQVVAQPLLIPVVVDLPVSEVALLLDQQEGLRRLGLQIEAFGNATMLVTVKDVAQLQAVIEALEGNLTELQEETPEALANVIPSPGIEIPQPIAHQ